MDERAVKRVNQFGWTKGGKKSVGLGDGPSLAGKCPVMPVIRKHVNVGG